MIITNQRENTVTFDSLRAGDVFIYDGVVYMKIKSIFTNYDTSFNAVSFDEGWVCKFNYEQVVLVEAELIIK